MKRFDLRKLIVVFILSVAIIDVIVILHQEKDYQTMKHENEVILDSIVNILKNELNNERD